MKNNYIKSERMWNVCKRYVLRMFYVISILFTFGVGQMWGSAGYYDKDGKGSSLRFLKNGSEYWVNMKGSPSSNIVDLGSNIYSLSLDQYYVYVWKNGSDISWSKMYYRVYKEGDTAPSFTEYSGSWVSDDGGKDGTTNQTWGKSSNMNINCFFDDIIGEGTYYFEYYFNTDNAGYLNNSSNNYKVKFKVCPRYFASDYIDSWSTTAHPLTNGIISLDNVTANTTIKFKLTLYNTWNHEFNWNSGSVSSNTSCGNTTISADGTNIKFTTPSSSATNVVISYDGSKVCVNCYPFYTVSVASGGNGTVSPSSVSNVDAYHSSSDITATPSTNYIFNNWTLPSGVTAADGYSTTSNPIRVNATAAGTITANFKSKWSLVGSMNSWNDATNPIGNYTTADGKTTGYVDVVLEANKVYSFKFKDISSSTYYKPTSNTEITYTNKATAQTMSNTGDGEPNQTIKTAGAGTYRFSWNVTDKKVTVTYPTSYTVTFDIGTVKGNSRTLIAYLNDNSSNKIKSGDYVASGTKVTFYAGGNTASDVVNPGYGWKGFYGNASGANPQLSSLTAYHINSISANTTVYACFYEIDYYITPYIEGQGSVSPNGQNGHIATPVSFTATPGTGYKFVNWTERGGSYLTIASPSATTTNVTTSAAATIQANFDPRWSVLGTGAFGGWSATGTNLFVNYEVVGGDDEGYYSIDLAANTDYEVKVYDRNTSTTYGGLSAQNVYYATSGADKPFTMATTSSGKSLTIHSAAAGEYWLNWNLTDKALALVYPTSWYITTGQSDAAGGSFTAVDNSSNDVKGGKFVADGATVTFTANKNTGYRFDGWFYNADYDNSHKYVDNNTDINLSGDDNKVLELSSIGADKAAYAKFTPKTYTVTLTRSGTGYGSGGDASVTATYNQTLPFITLPTAANGYAFMGYYTSTGGEGSQIINASGVVQTVDGYTDGDKKWIRDADTELFAYFKKAEITSLVLDPSTQAPSTSVTATPTIYPTPVGDKIVCWKLLRANGNLMSPQPEFSSGVGNAVSFTAPSASGSYKVACILRTGSSCDGGTVLDSVVADLVVAGDHTVTIRYQDGDGRTLAASSSVIGRPLAWSSDITAPTITGYTFTRWDAGDGVTIKNGDLDPVTTSTNATIKIKATYDGNLTAVYTKKRVIYFNNTLGWDNVYVYFYSGAYWDSSKGTGSETGGAFTNIKGQMQPISEGSQIYYFDAEAAGVNSSYTYVAFTELLQENYKYFALTGSTKNKVIYRGDYKSTQLPMFVPLAGVSPVSKNSDQAYYYNEGYWMNYPENTGYWLRIYNGTTKDVDDELMLIPFEFTADKTMPMELTVELEAGKTYGFEIKRNDGGYYGNNATMKIGASGDEGQTVWEFTTTATKRCGLKTSVAGDYTFKLTFGLDSKSQYNYLVGVHYPIAANDYRIVYNDRVAWSQSSSHSASWYHPSRTIHKENGAKDIVSFYVSKAAGASASMKFQYASSITNEGVVTWTDVSGGSISLTSITESGVYDFHLTQSGGSISVEKIEKYSGNYYIRTDNAGTTKWDNYRAADHQLTYSEFSKSRSTNTFGELYTHYYMHWCPRSTNIKFCIANDYSSCITDTLESDLTDWGNLSEGAWLKSDGANPDYKDKYSANIRFMYNESTNKISRAYLSSSTNKDRKFLVLRSNTEFTNSDGSALSGTGETSTTGTYEAIFQDNEDWIYEREVKLTPGRLFKIYASYAQATVQEDGSQHFRGSYSSDTWTKDETAVELIGGDGSACKARIIYDFKTNRLMAAYLPDNSEITGELDINADIMVIREHQEAGQQITFANPASALTDVKTVYGVMRFNRWILNNRQHPEDHIKEHGDTDAHIAEFHPLVGAGSMKSVYERALYWISFPFDVNLSEVFGFGTYGTHWIMMDYNGAERARIGYWKDNDEGFWTYIEDRRGVTLKAGRGYVLALELELMKANDNTFWNNQIQQVELFFPSASSTTGTISQTTVNVTVPDHECTIDRRTDKSTPDWNNDRRIADSHWNIIGVPSYANYGSTLSNGSSNITWQVNPKADGLPFLYEWNANDNTYTVQSGTKYNFKVMHAYYVQYAGTLRWTLASATPSIVARRTYAEESENVEFKLELTQNDKMIDQTFVKLSNDEEASTNFAFGEDLDKEFNDGKANVYTFIEGYIPSAGNTMPMTDQTTLVPVGVKITKAGEYTFAIPDGTSGVGVTLIDNVANTRTNLSALDYTVNLMAGTIDNRFVLEISPIHNAPTGIEEVTDDGLPVTGARKVLIDGILYIVKDGKMYDVRGTMIK